MVTDTLMAPVRKLILNLRMAKLDVGSLELTKDKSSAAQLLEVLAPLEAIEKYYYEAYLPSLLPSLRGRTVCGRLRKLKALTLPDLRTGPLRYNARRKTAGSR